MTRKQVMTFLTMKVMAIQMLDCLAQPTSYWSLPDGTRRTKIVFKFIPRDEEGHCLQYLGLSHPHQAQSQKKWCCQKIHVIVIE